VPSDMIAVSLGRPQRYAVVGSPAYFEKNPKPLHPRDLFHLLCMKRRFTDGSIYRWEFEKDGRELIVAVDGPLIVIEDRLAVLAAVNGAGLSYLFDIRVKQELADGSLIRVLEDWCPPYPGFCIYYPSRRQMRPALRAFIDFFKYTG